MKYLFTMIAAIALITTACGQNARNGYFGDKITEDGAIAASEVPAKLEGQKEAQLKVEGKINSVCKKKGCWMRMELGNGEEMMVRFKDYGFFVPLDCDGRTAVIEGTATVEEVSVDELRHYAEDAGKSKKEIAAITEPERTLTFLATGVIIRHE